MTDILSKKILPKSSLLRWQIGMALIIKVVLLTGLWFLIFRWQDRPDKPPDIAQHFALPSAPIDSSTGLSSQPKLESQHDR